MIDLRRARDFVYAHGTLWERALFAYLFQDAEVERLYRCLLCYKNPDGGYGHALEHDVRCPDSHPLALEFLLGTLVRLDIPVGSLLDGAAVWVEQARQPDGSLANPPAVLEYPHAPWWDGGGQSAPDSIVGNLERLGCATAALRQTTAAWAREHLTLETIRATTWLFMAYHAYDYFSSVAASDIPDHEARWQATIATIVACAERAGPKQYFEIFRFAPTPDTPMGRALPDVLRTRYLDYLEASQEDDGGWHDEHGLPQWRAYTTIVVLHGLRNYGRSIGAAPRAGVSA